MNEYKIEIINNEIIVSKINKLIFFSCSKENQLDIKDSDRRYPVRNNETKRGDTK